jgi:hypothetical protein
LLKVLDTQLAKHQFVAKSGYPSLFFLFFYYFFWKFERQSEVQNTRNPSLRDKNSVLLKHFPLINFKYSIADIAIFGWIAFLVWKKPFEVPEHVLR